MRYVRHGRSRLKLDHEIPGGIIERCAGCYIMRPARPPKLL
jgi:hypothetical protein